VLVTRQRSVFPSLGPTAYLLFFSPLAKTSSPRNTIFGHAIGLICGYAAFVGLTIRGSRRYLLAKNSDGGPFAFSYGAFMVLLDVNHPSAGATTLIVSRDYFEAA
jgi:CBS domain-containing membrane protein